VVEGAKLPISQNDLDALRDPKGQKGVQWRMQKLSVIRKLVKEGKSKAWVVWFLRTRTGLTPATARSLVEDAFLEEPKGEAEEGLPMSTTGMTKAQSDYWCYLRRRGIGETKKSKTLAGHIVRRLRGIDMAAAKKHSTSSKSERTKR
jgi:hypothetical protein